MVERPHKSFVWQDQHNISFLPLIHLYPFTVSHIPEHTSSFMFTCSPTQNILSDLRHISTFTKDLELQKKWLVQWRIWSTDRQGDAPFSFYLSQYLLFYRRNVTQALLVMGERQKHIWTHEAALYWEWDPWSMKANTVYSDWQKLSRISGRESSFTSTFPSSFQSEMKEIETGTFYMLSRCSTTESFLSNSSLHIHCDLAAWGILMIEYQPYGTMQLMDTNHRSAQCGISQDAVW